jgi:hypothetical protein
LCSATKAWSLACASLLAACGGSPRECLVGSDCISGECLADDTCAPPSSPDGSVSGSSGGLSTGGGDGSGGSSGGSSGSGSTAGGTTGSPLCDDSFTGTLTRAQVPVGPGLQATFEVAVDAGFDTAGAPQADGGYLWNLAGPFAGDHQELVQTEQMSSEWFGGGYPSASYAAVLSDLSPDLGVFAEDSSAISLAGVASPTQGSGDSELTYTPQVPVLSFPLQLGSSWQTDTSVTGTYDGYPVLADSWFESYAASVDKSGTALLPSGASLPVLRVRTDLVNTFGALVTTQRTYAFVTPCFGTIATVASQLDEPSVEFQNAAEIRRLQQP